MNKTRNNDLMKLANEALNAKHDLLKDDLSINSSYNGQIAAFGVAVAMSGLLPALAIYYNGGNAGVDRRLILDVLARMIKADKFKDIYDSKALLQLAMELEPNKSEFEKLKNEVIECAIALKQVVRTYVLKD